MRPFVRTPLDQALDEGVIERTALRQLMRRSNAPGLWRLGAWFVLVGAGVGMIHLAEGTVAFVPAMLLHGIVLVHHFSLQHECVHYTAFRSRWLNDIVGYYCGLVILLPHRFFRYEHCDHHTFTQLEGKDPERIPMPQNVHEYALYLSTWPYWKTKVKEITTHAAGRLTPTERRFIPREERTAVIWEARLMLGVYVLILGACWLWHWWAPLWYWWLPVILGEPFMRAIRMTEHVGRPSIADMTTNTRSCRVNPLLRFLCWNMNYHAEHHYASSVPFHALPRLHETLKEHIHSEPGGYLGAHRRIWQQLMAARRA